jgi:hypothetical protein
MTAAPSGCEDRWLGDCRDPAGRQAVFLLAFSFVHSAWTSRSFIVLSRVRDQTNRPVPEIVSNLRGSSAIRRAALGGDVTAGCGSSFGYITRIS